MSAFVCIVLAPLDENNQEERKRLLMRSPHSFSVVGFAVVVALACVDAKLVHQPIIVGRVPTPPPIVPYQSNPYPAMGSNIVPTSDPLVLDTTTAFVCFAHGTEPDAWCQMMSPANAAFTAPRVHLADQYSYSTFDEQPQLLQHVGDNASALYSSNNGVGSYWAASSGFLAMAPQNRLNSTAFCATDSATASAFVPFGVSNTQQDVLTSFNALDLNNVIYNYEMLFTDAANTPAGTSLLHNVIFYRGYLMFMRNNRFYQINATSKQIKFNISDPCGVGPEVGYRMTLATATFSSDQNGPLDAFLVYGNTTNSSGKPSFTMCRISHNTGLATWNFTLAENFVVHDITGGSSLILVSGASVLTAAGRNYVTLILNPATGSRYNFIARSLQDFSSFPIVVPAGVMPSSCGPAIIMQQHSNTTAFCLNPLLQNHTVFPLYVQPTFGCSTRPLFDPLSGQVVCINTGRYAWSFNPATGAPIWLDQTRQVLTTPQLVQENGNSYAFIMDIDTTMWGYQIPLVAPTTKAPTTAAPTTTTTAPTTTTTAPTTTTTAPSTTTQAPQQGSGSTGLSGGAKAAISIVVILVIAGLCAFVFLRRRQQRRALVDTSPRYGTEININNTSA